MVSPLTWYNEALEVAVSDVAPHNLISVEGMIAPFDIWARRIARA